MYSCYNRILDCDAGLCLANTWFPIYIYICMTPTSWSTVLRDSGLWNCPYWQREWWRRGVRTHTHTHHAGELTAHAWCGGTARCSPGTLVLVQHRPTSGLLHWTITAVLNSPGLALHRLDCTAVALALSLSQEMFAPESLSCWWSAAHVSPVTWLCPAGKEDQHQN